VKPNLFGLRLIEEIRGNRLLNVSSQIFPAIRLREDVVGKTFGDEAAAGFLCDTEYKFHGLILPCPLTTQQDNLLVSPDGQRFIYAKS
jgi:hypothetical protein